MHACYAIAANWRIKSMAKKCLSLANQSETVNLSLRTPKSEERFELKKVKPKARSTLIWGVTRFY